MLSKEKIIHLIVDLKIKMLELGVDVDQTFKTYKSKHQSQALISLPYKSLVTILAKYLLCGCVAKQQGIKYCLSASEFS